MADLQNGELLEGAAQCNCDYDMSLFALHVVEKLALSQVAADEGRGSDGSSIHGHDGSDVSRADHDW